MGRSTARVGTYYISHMQTHTLIITHILFPLSHSLLWEAIWPKRCWFRPGCWCSYEHVNHTHLQLNQSFQPFRIVGSSSDRLLACRNSSQNSVLIFIIHSFSPIAPSTLQNTFHQVGIVDLGTCLSPSHAVALFDTKCTSPNCQWGVTS